MQELFGLFGEDEINGNTEYQQANHPNLQEELLRRYEGIESVLDLSEISLLQSLIQKVASMKKSVIGS